MHVFNNLKRKFLRIVNQWAGGNRGFYNRNDRIRLGKGYYEEIGYELYLDYRKLRFLLERNALAKKVAEIFPDAIWTKGITIELNEKESDAKENIRINKEFKEIDSNYKLISKLKSVDVLLSVSRYCVILFGVNDGKQLDEELLYNAALDLTFINFFDEENCRIDKYENDFGNERYGLPIYYKIDDGNKSFKIHHSRVVHIIDNTLENNSVFGIPRLKSVYNNLTSLEKIIGSTAQAVYYNAKGGLFFNNKTDGAVSDDEIDKFKEQMEKFFTSMNKTLYGQHMDVKELNFPVIPLKNNFDTLIKELAGGTGIPQRILTGSERGELASSQDVVNFTNNIRKRRNGVCENNILRPVLDFLIDLKLIDGGELGYEVNWGDLVVLSDEERLKNADQVVSVLDKYSKNPLIQSLFSPESLEELLDRKLDWAEYEKKKDEILDLDEEDESDDDDEVNDEKEEEMDNE